MLNKIIVSLFIACLLLNGCALSASKKPTPTLTSGITGYVTEGPMCPGPVAVGKTTCPDQPFQATISILGTDNKKITSFQTDTAGYFKLSLSPGTYIIHPESDNVIPHAADQTVVVAPDQFTQVSIIYDTGMR
jgi:hypothetical protein